MIIFTLFRDASFEYISLEGKNSNAYLRGAAGIIVVFDVAVDKEYTLRQLGEALAIKMKIDAFLNDRYMI